VGPDRPQARVAETGAARTAPLFFKDGRIAFLTRRFDLNEDGVIDERDPAALVVTNRDGGQVRLVANLAPGEVPLRVWEDGAAILISTPGEDPRGDANGWVVSIDVQSGERRRIVQGFDVPLILPDGRLLVARLQARAAIPPPPGSPWMEPPSEEPRRDEPSPPSLLDPLEYHLHDPITGEEELLVRPGDSSAIVAHGDGSFFGMQARETSQRPSPIHPAAHYGPIAYSELLVIDDAQHRDLLAPNPRFSYQPIAWIEAAGLLVIERGNLGSRLLLFDRALKTHVLAEFDLFATGFKATPDGRILGWLEVEDTDENGYLEPWSDHARPSFLRLEP
jgi:hypothetical protein